ncbi:MAG TPA: hypothetical protein RMH99_25815 [Sandaracinaceae bacterium LLY-WYZ-13_1]|nr:hypothetical protein [Sandaracinaceae bacterium LLY-WYZ-13_1]
MRTALATLALSLVAFLLAPAAEAQVQLRPGLVSRTPVVAQPRVRVVSPRLHTTVSPPALRATTRATPAPAPARPGRVSCRVDENGVPARATFALLRRGQTVASGECGRPVEVPPGVYVARLTLETALDRPQRTVRVRVPEGGGVTARASFATSILEVRFTDARRPVHGLAILRRDGRTVGTLGSRVSARVSAGTYQIVARHRTEERTYTVTLAPGQRRALRARF